MCTLISKELLTKFGAGSAQMWFKTYPENRSWSKQSIVVKEIKHKLLLSLCYSSHSVLYSGVNMMLIQLVNGAGGNWQKWKRVFLTCPCHEIYRDEAVGLKSCKNTWKITIFVKMWNLGQYRENLIFCQ